MKKFLPDVMIIISILIIALIFFFVFSKNNQNFSGLISEKSVSVFVNGEDFGRFSLDIDKTINVDSEFGHNIITIAGGKVYVSEADCPDKLCVLSDGIENSGQQIVCLPNRVIVEIEDSKEGDYDAIAY